MFKSKFWITFHKEEFQKPYLVYVGTEHRFEIIIGLPFFSIDILWQVKDFMIETTETYFGKSYRVFTKNPKYKDDELKIWPPFEKQ